MKKVMIAAMAASVLATGAFGSDAYDIFSAGLSAKKTAPTEAHKTEKIAEKSPTTAKTNSLKNLCTNLGDTHFKHVDYFGQEKTITIPNSTQLMLDRKNPNMTSAEMIQKTVEAIKMKAEGSAFKKITVKNRSTVAAEAWIKKMIDEDKIIDHFSIAKHGDIGTAEYFVKAFKFLSAIDYPAKNDQDLKNEIIRRNVAMRIFFAHHKRNSQNNGYLYNYSLVMDWCGDNMDKIGPSDMNSPHEIVKHAIKNSLGDILHMIFEERYNEIVPAIEKRRVLKWKKDVQSPEAAMMDEIIEKLKNEKIIK